MAKHPQEQPEGDDTDKFADAGTDKDRQPKGPSTSIPSEQEGKGDNEDESPSQR